MMKRKKNQNDEPAEDEAPVEVESGEEEGGASAPEDFDELLRQRDDYLARWQRAAADYKNLRRRTQDDIDAAVRRTMMPLLENLLLVLDHLDLALTTEVKSDDAGALAQGVRLTRDQFLQGLQAEGVEPIDDGGQFDPNLHEAVAAIETDEVAPGSILETVRRGYTWRGLVLRHAHVKVSRETAGARESSDSEEPAEH